MQRRDFIGSGIGIGALCYAGISGAASAAAYGAPARLTGAAQFKALLRQQFMVYDGVRGIGVQLVKVRQADAAPGTQQFSLTFSGATADALEGGTYEVEHAAIGKRPMFLDASVRGQNGVSYRADFNLLG